MTGSIKAKTKLRLREMLDEAIAQGVTAGVSLGIWQDGEELFFTAQGYADQEAKRPMERNTIHRLYSMSKPVTAAAAVILMEEGRLDPAQPVSDFLPGFAHLTVEKDGVIVPVDEPMTVFQLLNMTSGLTYGDDVTVAGRMTTDYIEECVRRLHTDEAVSTVELANHLGTLPLSFVPGTSWQYGLSADVLGAVIEVASGMRFGDFLESRIFRPLGMQDTGFYVPGEKQGRLARAYEQTETATMKRYTGDNLAISNAMASNPAFESGGAGLVSTLDDYARFGKMLQNGGALNGVRVLSRAGVHFLTTGGLTHRQNQELWRIFGLQGFTYSNLMRIADRPQMCCMLAGDGEYGWDGWLGCYFANLPKEKITIVLMQQRKDSGTIPLTRRLRNVALADLLG